MELLVLIKKGTIFMYGRFSARMLLRHSGTKIIIETDRHLQLSTVTLTETVFLTGNYFLANFLEVTLLHKRKILVYYVKLQLLMGDNFFIF